MKLIFLGSGSAFTLSDDNFQSNMLFVNEDNDKLLLDCGSDIRWSLKKLGFTYKDIPSIYISHLHADHTGGLEWLAFTRKFDPETKKPNLYISQHLAHDLWNGVLSGGLSSIETVDADLATYFTVKPIADNGYFIWSNIEFRLVQTVHFMSGFKICPSYGLLFTVNELNVFITTDTQFSPHQLTDFYNMADLIFQDCETTPNKSNVHAHYDELVTLDPKIKKKMWLYHYNQGELPDAKKAGFRGFVKRGQTFDFADPNTL